MARRASAPPAKQPAHLSSEQIGSAIPKLERRLREAIEIDANSVGSHSVSPTPAASMIALYDMAFCMDLAPDSTVTADLAKTLFREPGGGALRSPRRGPRSKGEERRRRDAGAMGMSRETRANGVAGRWRHIGAVAVIWLAALGPAAGAETTAQGVVDRFHRSLISVMTRASELGYRGRFQALSPEIARAFHLPVMARIVAGYHWKNFTRDQKSALVRAFGRMTTATYAHRFDGYSGEKFRIVGEAPSRRKSVIVKSEIVKSDGEAIAINYLMRKFKRGWRVVDVQLKGVYSELATRRSEYSSILRRSGLATLLAEIDGKIAAYEAEERGRY